MRVLLTNTGPWGTGSAMVAEGVLEELRQRGHQAILFFPDAQLDSPEKRQYYSQPDRYHIWRFPVEREGRVLRTFPLMIPDPNPRSGPEAWTFRDLSDELLEFYFQEAQRELQQVIAGFCPDVVECQHIWTMPYLISELGLPYVVTAHHSDQMGYEYDRRMQPYANLAAAGARWIFAVSEFSQREVRDLYPDIQPEKVVVLENGYNQRVFRRRRVSRAHTLRALGIEDVPRIPIITFSGKISYTKGVDILLKANRLVQGKQKALLLIAGTGELEREFSAEERGEFHLENVWFLGHQPQSVVAQLHNLATVSVLPSRSEGFGLAALEAMGCGTPVVSTRCGGPETYVVGATVPVGTVEELATALLQLLSLEAGAARELSQAAFERAQRYSWERLIERRLHYYRQIHLAAADASGDRDPS